MRASIAKICTTAAIILLTFDVASSVAQNSIVRRTTLLVRDAEASKAFYQALGFKEWLDWSENQDPDALSGLPLNAAPSARPTKARIVIMKGTDPYVAMIGLLEHSNPPLVATRVPSEVIGVTDIVLVIETDDIIKVQNNLQNVGARIARAPKSYESNGPSGRKAGVDMLVFDPDGHVVEISQVLKRQSP